MEWRLVCICLLMGCFELGEGSYLTQCTNSIRELGNNRRIVTRTKEYKSYDFFVHKKLPELPRYAFTDVYLQLNLTNDDDYTLYQGVDCASAVSNIDDDNRWFGFFKTPVFTRSRQLDLFNDTVIAISTMQPYEISVIFKNVNMIRLSLFVCCILIFLFSRHIVRHAGFFYVCGSSFGVVASILLIAFVAYRFAPRGLIGAPIMLGGWSMSLYILHYAWTHFTSIMMLYKVYVISYFVGVILISLAICYKRGPPTDVRSQDLMQWSLQGISLCLIYASCQLTQLSMMTAATLFIYQLLGRWLSPLIGFLFLPLTGPYKWFKFHFFPPRHEFLTMEEYHKQAQLTTERELEKLRQYCLSPKADSWKLMSNVRSPNRLARFSQGAENHISNRELRLYEEYESERENELEDDFEEDDGRLNGSDEDVRGVEDEEQEEEESWDEIVVRRKSRDNRPASVERYRVPPNISSTLTQRISHYSPRNLDSSRNSYSSPRTRQPVVTSPRNLHNQSAHSSRHSNGKRHSKGNASYLNHRQMYADYSDSE